MHEKDGGFYTQNISQRRFNNTSNTHTQNIISFITINSTNIQFTTLDSLFLYSLFSYPTFLRASIEFHIGFHLLLVHVLNRSVAISHSLPAFHAPSRRHPHEQ